MNVTVMGLGYVGLPTAVVLASFGHQITGYDVDLSKIRSLQAGNSPIFEDGLEEALRRELDRGALCFTADPAKALETANLIMVCVGTPPKANGGANLAAIEETARVIAQYAPSGTVVVEKSTVPSGTGRRVKQVLSRAAPNKFFYVASSPEFLREGTALEDTLSPTRLVFGTDDAVSLKMLRDLYDDPISYGVSVVECSIETAELAKHASNSLLATKISFINNMARVCESAGADVEKVAEIMGLDPRIGNQFLQAGLGFGGYCFPKDVAALQQHARELGVDFGLLDYVLEINREAVISVADVIEDALWNLSNKRIALLGLAFKPGTDDTRFSPAIALADELIDRGATVVAYDPVARENALRDRPELLTSTTALGVIQGADLIVVATEWPEFLATYLPKAAAEVTDGRIVVDARNCLTPKEWTDAGFLYVSVGRQALHPTPHAAEVR